MKIFDFNNPNHIKILKEELNRAKRLLEYNESNEWKRLTPTLRKLALQSADDDMGSDFADEYAESDWMQIPDAITNRIDLSKFILPKKVDTASLAQWIETNKDKIGTGALYTEVGSHSVNDVIKFLQSGRASQYYCAEVIAAILMRGVMIDFKELEPAADPLVQANRSMAITNNPYNYTPGRRTSNWTGD